MGVVYQVEGFAQVDHERVLALTHEQPRARRAATGNGDVVNEIRRICGVIGNRLLADIVNRLGEDRAAAAGVGYRLFRACASIPADDVHLIGLGHIQAAGYGRIVNQRDGDRGAVDIESDVFGSIRKLKLERDFLFGVAVVVDQDLVEGRRIQLEVVRTGK